MLRPLLPGNARITDSQTVAKSAACALLWTILSPCLAATPEAQLRTALEAKTGVITLPAGIIEIAREIVLRAGV